MTLCARGGHSGCLRLLASFGADVNAVDEVTNWTPIFEACAEGYGVFNMLI